MKQFLVLIVLFLTLRVSSQVVNNLVVFCNDPEPFTLILNGMRQNATPATSVRVEGLTLAKYSVKIIFSSGRPKDHSTILTFFSTGTECVFALNKKGKRKYTMDYLSEKPMEGFGDAANKNTSVDPPVNPTDNTQGNNTSTNTNPQDNNNPGSSPPVNGNNNQGIGITLPNLGTVSFGNGNVGIQGTVGGVGVNINEPIKKKHVPLTDEEFIAYINKVSLQVTDEDKQKLGLSLLKKKYILVAQIKDILALFSTEPGKLDFVKKVYPFASDKENYNQLESVFTVEASKQELKDFIEKN
jgi:hypothetical protein